MIRNVFMKISAIKEDGGVWGESQPSVKTVELKRQWVSLGPLWGTFFFFSPEVDCM